MSFNSNRICLIQIAMEAISFKCCYGIDFIIQKSPRGVIIHVLISPMIYILIN